MIRLLCRRLAQEVMFMGKKLRMFLLLRNELPNEFATIG